MARPVRRPSELSAQEAIAFPDLLGLDGRQMEARLLDYLDEVMDLAEPERDRQLELLPRPLQVLWLLDALDYEVSQASLLTFVLANTARRVAQTLDSLRMIGALHTEAAVLAAIDAAEEVIDLGEQDRIRDPATGVAREAEVAAPGLAASLTDRYWDAAQADGWGQLLEDYVLSSRQALLSLGLS